MRCSFYVLCTGLARDLGARGKLIIYRPLKFYTVKLEKCGTQQQRTLQNFICTAVRVNIPACLVMSRAEWGRAAEAIHGKVWNHRMAGAFRKGIERFEVRIVAIFSHADFEVGNSPFRFPAGARGLPLLLSLQTGSWNRPSRLFTRRLI